MPTFDFTVTATIRTLDNATLLGELLFFPEASRLAHNRDRLRASLRDAAIASIPEPGIEVIASSRADLDARLPGEIRAESMRRQAALGLAPIIWLQRTRSLEVTHLTVPITLPALKKAADEQEAARERVVLVLGNLVEMMEVGRHATRPQGMAGFLRPFLARGEVPVAVECTPEQLPLIERMDPQLLQLFRQLPLEPPNPDRLRAILTRAADRLVRDTATSVAPEAMDAVARLHERFATYSAPPGRPLRFLRALVQDAADAFRPQVTPADAAAAFAAETGLPQFLIDPETPLDLEAAHDWFAQRLMEQPEPVRLTVDARATVKAALTRPRQPVPRSSASAPPAWARPRWLRWASARACAPPASRCAGPRPWWTTWWRRATTSAAERVPCSAPWRSA